MKSLVVTAAAAVLLVAPALSFAQSAQSPVTRAQVLQELIDLESVGYNRRAAKSTTIRTTSWRRRNDFTKSVSRNRRPRRPPTATPAHRRRNRARRPSPRGNGMTKRRARMNDVMQARRGCVRLIGLKRRRRQCGNALVRARRSGGLRFAIDRVQHLDVARDHPGMQHLDPGPHLRIDEAARRIQRVHVHLLQDMRGQHADERAVAQRRSPSTAAACRSRCRRGSRGQAIRPYWCTGPRRGSARRLPALRAPIRASGTPACWRQHRAQRDPAGVPVRRGVSHSRATQDAEGRAEQVRHEFRIGQR